MNIIKAGNDELYYCAKTNQYEMIKYKTGWGEWYWHDVPLSLFMKHQPKRWWEFWYE